MADKMPIRTIKLEPSPAGTFRIFERFLTSVSVELQGGTPNRARKTAIIKQIQYVRDELSKWPKFLEGVTWEELEALGDNH